MPSAKVIVLEYVCPAAGMITANLMFSAPYRDVRKAAEAGTLGDLNPTPWAFMLGNCVGWIIYSMLIRNFFVFFANIFAFLLSAWFNMIAMELQYGASRSNLLKQSIIVALDDQSRSFMMEQAEPTKIPTRDLPHPSSTTTLDYANIIWDVAAQKTKAPMAHKVLVLVMVVVWTAVCSFLGFGTHVSSDTRTMVVGVVVNVNLVFFYAAPLSTIADVLKTRSCATIHVPTMLTNTLNGVFWCVFGFAVLDWFIAVPNGIGACLGFIQIVLILIYPQSRLGKEPMDTEAIRDPTIVDRSREER